MTFLDTNSYLTMSDHECELSLRCYLFTLVIFLFLFDSQCFFLSSWKTIKNTVSHQCNHSSYYKNISIFKPILSLKPLFFLCDLFYCSFPLRQMITPQRYSLTQILLSFRKFVSQHAFSYYLSRATQQLLQQHDNHSLQLHRNIVSGSLNLCFICNDHSLRERWGNINQKLLSLLCFLSSAYVLYLKLRNYFSVNLNLN